MIAVVCAASLCVLAPATAAGPSSAESVRQTVSAWVSAGAAGSPQACELMTPRAQRGLVTLGSALLGHTSTCAKTVATLAKLAARSGDSQGLARLRAAHLAAVARGKVTIAGSKATLADHFGISGSTSSEVIRLVWLGGRWLIDDFSGSAHASSSFSGR